MRRGYRLWGTVLCILCLRIHGLVHSLLSTAVDLRVQEGHLLEEPSRHFCHGRVIFANAQEFRANFRHNLLLSLAVDDHESDVLGEFGIGIFGDPAVLDQFGLDGGLDGLRERRFLVKRHICGLWCS